jgi:hypothetical protein
MGTRRRESRLENLGRYVPVVGHIVITLYSGESFGGDVDDGGERSSRGRGGTIALNASVAARVLSTRGGGEAVFLPSLSLSSILLTRSLSQQTDGTIRMDSSWNRIIGQYP